MLAFVSVVAAHMVDRPVLGRAISQAPGLSGMPSTGHCSSAATRASWAKILGQADVADDPGQPGDEPGDSIRQTASMVRWVSVADMTTDHTKLAGQCKMSCGSAVAA